VLKRRVPWWLALILVTHAPILDEERLATQRLAAVLSELVHECTPVQRVILEAIIADRSATAAERELARALVRFHHVPAPADMPRLHSWMADPFQRRSVRTLARVVYGLVHAPTEADRASLAELLSGGQPTKIGWPVPNLKR
jgi:hypothetical protein